jgi:hypothetical protein
MSCDGQLGFRSLGHDATEHFAEGVIIIGMLNPSTTDTTYTSLVIQSGSFRTRGGGIGKKVVRTVVKVFIPVALERPFRHRCGWNTLHGTQRMEGRGKGRQRGRVSWVYVNDIVGERRTVPVWGSHWSPPLQPPSRQLFAPGVVEKSQFRRP